MAARRIHVASSGGASVPNAVPLFAEKRFPYGPSVAPARYNGHGSPLHARSSAAKFFASSHRRPAARTMGCLSAPAVKPAASSRPFGIATTVLASCNRSTSLAIHLEGATTQSAAWIPRRASQRYLFHSGGATAPLTLSHQDNTHECATISTGADHGSAPWQNPLRWITSARMASW